MKLESLALAHCRGFEQLDLVFEPDVTVIAGINGVGKSTVLDALAVVLSRAMPEFTPSRSVPMYFTDDDIYGDKASLTASVCIALAGQTLNAGVQRLRGIEEQGDRFVLLRKPDITSDISFTDALRKRTLTGDLDAGFKETRAALSALKSVGHPPIAVYFTPKRHLPGQPRNLPAVKPFDPAIAYGRALHDREVELREFMHWFHTQEKIGSANEPNRLRVLDALRRVVTGILPEFSNLRIQEQPRLGFVVDKRGQPFFLHQLSDGERGLLAVVFDLARRLAIANPYSENPITDGVALVLIDEIELHLHPKWQRQVLRLLQSTFSRCQFVVTTHSPQVIGQVRPEQLRLLHYDETGKVVLTKVSQSFGMDSSWILQNIMGVPARDYDTEQRVSEIYRAIDTDDLEIARCLAEQLRSEIGDFPDLQEAIALLDRFALLRST